ncbi:MAG: hypothetical protein ACK5RZ_14100, partial [Akkermansiaceae bacterium]|nr:hypothetical protein [Luteolibacter sp.]
MRYNARGWHDRGYLPHLELIGRATGITFRLADSLPKHVIEQGVCLAGLFLDRACSRDEFHGFFAIIPVIIEGVVEGFELFEGDDCE